MQVEYKQFVQEKLQLAFQSQIATCNLHFATEAAVSVSFLCVLFCDLGWKFGCLSTFCYRLSRINDAVKDLDVGIFLIKLNSFKSVILDTQSIIC